MIPLRARRNSPQAGATGDARLRPKNREAASPIDRRRIAPIDEYIAQFDAAVQAVLRELGALVREAAPAAAERIGCRMPAFHLHGSLVYFAAWKRHIGFSPTSSAEAAFAGELAAYAQANGSIQLPLDEPLPRDLIRRVVEFKAAENRGREASRRRKRRVGAAARSRCTAQESRSPRSC